MKNIILIFITIFLLFGCTAKTNQNIVNNTNINTTLENNSDEDFLDEFENDTQVVKNDPFEPYNRVMSSFNDTVYMYVFNPVSKTYAAFIPKIVRKGVSNFFKNLLFPVRVSNNLLQGKFKNSLEETERFLINSTVGVFGIFDIAKENFDINPHNEDFGQTLGFWGVSSGPHIVLPLLGPSNLRDLLSLPADFYLDPTSENGNLSYKIPNNYVQGSLLFTVNYVNKNSLNLGVYETLKKDSLDFYTFTRDFYEEKRKNDIKE